MLANRLFLHGKPLSIYRVLGATDYLYVPRKSVSSMRDVTQLHAGLYYYQHDPSTEARVIAAASEIDEGDVELAWTLYNNPDLIVIGPNDVRR